MNQHKIHTYSSEYVTQSISYENTQYDYQVLQDDEFIRKIRVTTANETSTAEYNKVTGEYTLLIVMERSIKIKLAHQQFNLQMN